MLLNHYSGGTISHRPIVGPLVPDIGSLSVHPSKPKKSDKKIGQGKKFNSLKFNF
jgi:hypothetical protein